MNFNTTTYQINFVNFESHKNILVHSNKEMISFEAIYLTE